MQSNKVKAKVSIIIPWIRKSKLDNCIKLIKKNSGINASRYEIIAEEDKDRIGCPLMVKKLIEKSKYPYICFLGDDSLPQKDFLTNALTEMKGFKDHVGLVGFNDKTEQILPTHWLSHKDILKHIDGEFFHTGYNHCFCDNELLDRVSKIGLFHPSAIAVVEHDHPLMGRKTDKDYDKIYSKSMLAKDKSLYDYRKSHNWKSPVIPEMKLAIGMPLVNDQIDVLFFKSYMEMKKPPHVLLFPRFPSKMNHEKIRNDLVEQAIYHNCTHLLMMDTDQIYPSGAITRILEHKDKDIIAGVVHRRHIPFDPIIYKGSINNFEYASKSEAYSDNLIEADATGCGFVLFNMKIFDKIPHPWFETYVDEQSGRTVGEDIAFHVKAKQYGYQLYIDTSIQIGHISKFVVTKELHELFKKFGKEI